ncbi:putative cation channel sperm-associated protein 3 [Paratrimastix pyriformis]|uniref:Cation channel sperm-associated protein 3 n=1 Tax=Paratrimastix pyriformis TaxID=342808 RepID=A0ABQ8UK51_9EUKA|nr:putative cation channel sperm-associated protein 3 [Paratrimastix pyriformis]
MSVSEQSFVSGGSLASKGSYISASGEAHHRQHRKKRHESLEEDEGETASMFLRRADDDEEEVTVFRNQIHEFACYFTYSRLFSYFTLSVVAANTITIAIQTDREISTHHAAFFTGFDIGALVIFSFEFLLKLYCAPIGYWKSNYNRFDFIIVVLGYLEFVNSINVTFLRVIRTFRALRAFRAISYFRQFQIIFSSLVKTVVSILNLIAILFLMVYVYGVVGFYLFQEGEPVNWGNLGQIIITMHIYITADGWTTIVQNTLDGLGKGSRWFSIGAIFIFNILFTNLFIGVILQNLSVARADAEALERARRKVHVDRKKAVVLERQKQEWQSIMEAQRQRGTTNVDALMATMAGRLRHEDIVPCQLLSCSVVWLRTYVAVLHHQENNMYRVQQLQFELADTLADSLEDRLDKRDFSRPWRC